MRAGATPAFVNWRLSPRELTEVLDLVEPAAVAADAEFAGLVDAAWPVPAGRVVIGGPDRTAAGAGRPDGDGASAGRPAAAPARADRRHASSRSCTPAARPAGPKRSRCGTAR